MLTIGSLFSGIGGLELGLEMAGLGPTIWQVEHDEFCGRVLASHWPDADRSVTDVREAGRHNLEPVDLICGGFPCQDISYAGKGAGLDGARSGLWFEYLRIVRELQPRFVVVENVAALATRGLDVVLGSLAESGYDAIWTSLRASDVGAPHRRDRLFVVAYTRRVGGERRGGPSSVAGETGDHEGQRDQRQRMRDSAGDCIKALAYTATGGARSPASAETESGSGSGREGDRQAQPRLGLSTHGIPGWVAGRWPSRPNEPQEAWEAPRTISRENPSDKSPRPPPGFRTAQLRALGNAVVPQCTEVIGWMIQTLEGSKT
jgi:DNA (cytosine-5)-methyltransferase 1